MDIVKFPKIVKLYVSLTTFSYYQFYYSQKLKLSFLAILIVLYFSLLSINGIMVSTGGDSYGGLAYFNNCKSHNEENVCYAQPFKQREDYHVPNFFLDICLALICTISFSASIYQNNLVIIGLFITFICTLLIGSNILTEFDFKIPIIWLFSIIVVFSPYISQHLFTGHFGLLPVFVILWMWAFFLLNRDHNYKTVLLLGIISGISTIFNTYYGYFCLLLHFYIYGYLIIFGRKIFRRVLISSLFSGLIAIFMVIVFLFPALEMILNSKEMPIGTAYNRPFISLTGVLPWMYFLPPADHFLSPKWYVDFYRKAMLLSNIPENSVYLTWFNIGFFIYGIKLFFSKCFSYNQHSWFRFCFGGAIFCFLISLPPFVPLGEGKRFFWISTYLHKLFPMFRTYNRMGFFVIIFVTICALISFSYFLSKHKRHGKKIVICAFVLLCFELMPKIPLIDIENYPKVYDWLKHESGDFIVYEIPDDGEGRKDDFTFYKYLYYQTIHKKKLFNRAPIDINLQDIELYYNMKKWNVKYIIQHKDFYDIGPIPSEQKRYLHPDIADLKYNNGIPEKLPIWFKVKKVIGNSVVYSLN